MQCQCTGLGVSVPPRKPLSFRERCHVHGHFSLCGNTLELWTTSSPFLTLGAYNWLVGICLLNVRVFNPDPFISGSNKSTVFLWTLCLAGVGMLWSKCMCAPDRVRGGGLAFESAALWVGEQGGERRMLESTSYVLPCHLEVCRQVFQLVMGQYREVELEPPTVNTPVRGLWKKGGEIENRANVSKVCWCRVEINHRPSESQTL